MITSCKLGEFTDTDQQITPHKAAQQIGSIFIWTKSVRGLLNGIKIP
jgi:hypothetical protein